MSLVVAALLGLLLTGCAEGAQEPDTVQVVSSDPELRELVQELLPAVATRSGLELVRPVRVERRSREELERYLVAKLDEELPPETAERITRAYALLGMVPEGLDLRALFLDVYTEQVAGFYDADSTALFVLDDQPPAVLVPLLVHELVHAVQDQAADLDSLTDRSRGNDRQTAAQAAIEGHATLVMFEQMMGGGGDIAQMRDFAARIRPALEAARTQYPALAGAPKVIRESVLFPYLEGAGFVQALWVAALEAGDPRPAPFGDLLPTSTEQVIDPSRFLGVRDEPTGVRVGIEGRDGVYANTLGQLETRILLEEIAGEAAGSAAVGWDGDQYVLVGSPDAGGLALATVWDSPEARDAFVGVVGDHLSAFPRPAAVAAREVQGRPVSVLRIGDVPTVEVRLGGEGEGGSAPGPAPGVGGGAR